jgi:hypothetical protein|uniref:Uncharacterized protein n=1 Tax=Siphoviridae sp. ct6rT12 TaxID=2825346 RepID=A0A8S5V9G4_9CAUD|nr:MAG TPA: hypothetical protein [Siphoviridae sp. ct6rT12]
MFYKIWIFSLIIVFIYFFIAFVFLDRRYPTTKFEDFLIFVARMLIYYFFISIIILSIIGSYIFIFKII